ncbi:MAG TPA: hypothetical protein VML54_05255, partial [Candidatus Limnocylindrales bacterium]|nr:hypothetical protein [Candidatus Limnocylindrales bacterium]
MPPRPSPSSSASKRPSNPTPFAQQLNDAINQTLSRTVLTSLTTPCRRRGRGNVLVGIVSRGDVLGSLIFGPEDL